MGIIQNLLKVFTGASEEKKLVDLSHNDLISKAERVIQDISNGVGVGKNIEELGDIAALSHDVAMNKAVPLFQSLLSSGLDCEKLIVGQFRKIGLAHENLAREQIVPSLIAIFGSKEVGGKVVTALGHIGEQHPSIAKDQIVPAMMGWVDGYETLASNDIRREIILATLAKIGWAELDKEVIVPFFKKYIDEVVRHKERFPDSPVRMLNDFIADKALADDNGLTEDEALDELLYLLESQHN